MHRWSHRVYIQHQHTDKEREKEREGGERERKREKQRQTERQTETKGQTEPESQRGSSLSIHLSSVQRKYVKELVRAGIIVGTASGKEQDKQFLEIM